MGLLTGIKALIGTPKIVSTVADTVQSGMEIWDNSKFTEQEQSTVSLKFANLWLKIQEATAGENSIKSITRRILAWSIVGNFLFIVNIGMYLIITGKTEKATALKDWVVDIKFGWMAVSVVIFYFGYYSVQAIRNAKK